MSSRRDALRFHFSGVLTCALGTLSEFPALARGR
ncbi:twin-arginine translocation signal domain-containing protein [Burkholderia sp. BE17]|nr:twin-arginine translocation signal domain-containing protein [Burkholderia sp. BE17]